MGNGPISLASRYVSSRLNPPFGKSSLHTGCFAARALATFRITQLNQNSPIIERQRRIRGATALADTGGRQYRDHRHQTRVRLSDRKATPHFVCQRGSEQSRSVKRATEPGKKKGPSPADSMPTGMTSELANMTAVEMVGHSRSATRFGSFFGPQTTITCSACPRSSLH